MEPFVIRYDLEPPFCIIKPGMSEEEFYRLADEDSDWEYLDGRIVMHSPASRLHERLFGFLLFLITGFLGQKRVAEAFGSRYPMRLDARWSPEPDILVVRNHRRHLLAKNRLEGPADMVIEIVSEGDPGLELRENLPRYREAGIEEIWLVDPFQKTIRVEVKGEDGYSARILSAGRLESKVLPGFWIEVEWLWRDEMPPALDCLRGILGSTS